VPGLGSARAAISVVNALPLGIGSAVGIDWPARTRAYLAPTSRGGGPDRTSVEPAASATPIVRAAARLAGARYGGSGNEHLHLVVRSTIPVARGLKSSSAIGSSVVLATARALGSEPGPEEVARLSAEAGRAAAVSATGAFDDALAGLVPGGVVTDNRTRRALRRLDVPVELVAALWVPHRRHPRSPLVRERFRREPALARRAADAALAGDWARAMELNTGLVERAMGYRYGQIHERVRAAGAIASGVSGLGPAFVALAPRERIPAVVRALPGTGRRRSVALFLGPRASTEDGA